MISALARAEEVVRVWIPLERSAMREGVGTLEFRLKGGERRRFEEVEPGDLLMFTPTIPHRVLFPETNIYDEDRCVLIASLWGGAGGAGASASATQSTGSETGCSRSPMDARPLEQTAKQCCLQSAHPLSPRRCPSSRGSFRRSRKPSSKRANRGGAPGTREWSVGDVGVSFGPEIGSQGLTRKLSKVSKGRLRKVGFKVRFVARHRGRA